MTNNELKIALQTIINDTYGDTLETEVAKVALEHDNIALFFSDFLKNGCISGWIASLTWYSQTRKFYDKHYDEIEDLRYEYEDMGCTLHIKGDLKNFYAWFAFEVTASCIAEKLGIG